MTRERRAFLSVAAALGFALVMPASAQQPGRTYRVGWLSLAGRVQSKLLVDRGLGAMAQKGFEVGRNVLLDWRTADLDAARLDQLAADLAAARPDLIIAVPATAAFAMKRATSSVPIVAMSAGDPVGEGLAASFAKPGGNVTGVSYATMETGLKRFELLKEIFPATRRVRLLTQKIEARFIGMASGFATRAGMVPTVFFVEDEGDLARFFAIPLAQDEAVLVATTGWNSTNRKAIVSHANRVRAPIIYPGIEYADVGGLVTYQSDFREAIDRIADIAVRVLRGGRPAEIPFEQVTRLYLVINQRTASEIGMSFPASVRLRADRVIE